VSPATTSPSATRGRGRPRDPELDTAILDAARELLFAEGVRGFTLLEVARRAGVPKSTVYRRWAGRREMLTAALEAFGAEPEDLPDTGTLRGDLIVLVGRSFEHTGAIGALLSIGLEASMDADLQPVVRSALDQKRRALYPVLQRGIARNELRADVDFDAVLHQVYGVVWSRVVSQRADIDAAAIEAIVDRALVGLSPH
jgi:AcrR family transcriptional regulator